MLGRQMLFQNSERIKEYEFEFEDKTGIPGLSAMLRVKNEESIIEASILSIIDFVDEVRVIDNNSSDNTRNIVEKLKQDFPTKIFLSHYPFTVTRNGREFANIPENSIVSLAYYYNWCKSLCQYSHVLKWDADMVVPETSRHLWQKMHNWSTQLNNVIIRPNGKLVIIDHQKVFRDSGILYQEPRIYPNTEDFYFVRRKGCFTERISYKGRLFFNCLDELNILSSIATDYYEIKDLGKDEFDHFAEEDIHLEVKQHEEYTTCLKVAETPDNYPVITGDKYLNLIKT